MKTKIPILALALILVLVAVDVALAIGNVELPRWVLSGGASDSAGGDVSLRATLGQPVVAVVSDGDIVLRQGFSGAARPGYIIYLPLVMRS